MRSDTQGSDGQGPTPGRSTWIWRVGLAAFAVLLAGLLAIALPKAVALAMLVQAEYRQDSTLDPRWIVILGGGSGHRVSKALDLSVRCPQAQIVLVGSRPELDFMGSIALRLRMRGVRFLLVDPPTTQETAKALAGLDGRVVIVTHRWHARRVRYLWIRETLRWSPDILLVDDGSTSEVEILKLLWTILFY